MVKHNQTISRLLLKNCLSEFDHFVVIIFILDIWQASEYAFVGLNDWNHV